MVFPDIPVIPKHPPKQLMSLGLASRRGGGRGCLHSALCPAAGRLPGTGAPRNSPTERAGPSLPRPDPRAAAGTMGSGHGAPATPRSRTSRRDSDSGLVAVTGDPSAACPLAWEEAGASLCCSRGAGVKSWGTPTDTAIRGAQRSHVGVQPARPHLRCFFPPCFWLPRAPEKICPLSRAGEAAAAREQRGAVPVDAMCRPRAPSPAEAAPRGRRGLGARERADAGRAVLKDSTAGRRLRPSRVIPTSRRSWAARRGHVWKPLH